MIAFLRSPVTAGAFVAAWIAGACNVAFHRHFAAALPAETPQRTLVLALTVLMMALIFNAAIQLVYWGRRTAVVPIVLVIVAAVAGYASLVFGVGFNADQIQNVIETDTREAGGYLNWLGAFALAGLIAPPVALLLWARRSMRLPRMAAIKAGVVVASLLGAGAIVAAYFVDFASTFRAHRELRTYIAPVNVFAGLRGYYRKTHKVAKLVVSPYGDDAHRAHPGGRPRLFVFVLGETARAGSFSLGGYGRPTNPNLARENIVYFPKTTSCGTATTVSVPCIFSGMTRAEYDPDIARARWSLLDIAQRAGYEADWLENNTGCKGACDRIRSLRFSPEIARTWCPDGARDFCDDTALGEELKLFLGKEPARDRIVVLHQIGSHGPSYFKRYPDDLPGLFKPDCRTSALQTCDRQALINAYDNSILETDRMLSRLIEQLKQETRYDTALLYVSDHGESTGERGVYLHGAPYALAPAEQTHVPMLFWLSDSMKQAAAKAADCLAARRDADVSHDNVFPTVLGMLDIETSTRRTELDLTRCS
jgi:lipid A ethanolaminephosphotransferase